MTDKKIVFYSALIFITLISLGFLAVGCDSGIFEDSATSSTGGDKYFPLKVGNVWTYQSDDGTIRTVSITGTTTISGKTCYIANYRTAISSSEALFLNDENGCWFYGTPSFPLSTPQLQFSHPLSLGKYWNPVSGTTSECVAIQDIELTNGVTYTNCYRIRTSYSFGTQGDIWIKEDVGWVKSTYSTTSSELIGVDLK